MKQNQTKEHHTLTEMFESSCITYECYPAIICNDAIVSYAKMGELSRNIAAWLQNEAFFTRGDCIAIMLPNSLQYAISVMGGLRSGMVVVNINPNSTRYEIEKYMMDCCPKAIITLPELKEKCPEGDNLYIIEAGMDDFPDTPDECLSDSYEKGNLTTLEKIIFLGQSCSFTAPEVKQNTLAFLQYTGGTSGIPKAAMLTHGNIAANLNQLHHVCGEYLTKGKERIVTALPLYHIFSLTVNFLYFFSIGAVNIFIRDARKIDDVISAMMKYKFTAITGVNTLYNALLNHHKFTELDFSAVNFCVSGGTELVRPVAEKWFGMTGKPILAGYGMTECSPLVSVQSFATTQCLSNVGCAVTETQIKLVDADGNTVSPGEKGEVAVKGPQVMSGYWKRDGETHEALRDGWYFTGDLAVQDRQGVITIQGRKKDIIIVSGFNVYPAEIEAVVLQHPSVKEAVAIGVQDDVTGEAIKLFIVPSDITPMESDIRDYCRKFVTSYKVPKHIEYIDALPKSGVGKVLRYKLKGISE